MISIDFWTVYISRRMYSFDQSMSASVPFLFLMTDILTRENHNFNVVVLICIYRTVSVSTCIFIFIGLLYFLFWELSISLSHSLGELSSKLLKLLCIYYYPSSALFRGCRWLWRLSLHLVCSLINGLISWIVRTLIRKPLSMTISWSLFPPFSLRFSGSLLMSLIHLSLILVQGKR